MALDELPWKSNYLTGGNASEWRTNVPNFRRVKYEQVYPGIDLIYYGEDGSIEYDFTVAPHRLPQSIVMQYAGASDLKIDDAGDLILSAGTGQIRQRRPVAYQEMGGVKRLVECSYRRVGARGIGFSLGPYDRTRPLTIDPVLVYSTYYGSNGNDNNTLGDGGIAVDAQGNAYVVGTECPDNHCRPYLLKLDPDGTPLYITHLGAEDGYGTGVAVDGAGSAYITGYSSGRIVTVNPVQPAPRGSYDAFITKIDPSGAAIVYSTLLGGSGSDQSYGIALDSAGNAFVAGRTNSSDFPTVNPYQPEHQPNQQSNDAFIAEINAAGTGYVYATYLGGGGDDNAFAIAVDSSGSAYVAGTTRSADFPVTQTALQTTLKFGDAFLTKLTSGGSALAYSTYIGGDDIDFALGLTIDAAGNAYVTGNTISHNFPTVNAAQPVHGGGMADEDGFLCKVNTDGTALIYSTYIGGSNTEGSKGVAVDSSGNAYITGNTSSLNFPRVNSTQPPRTNRNPDAFAAQYGPSGDLLFTSYFGGVNEVDDGEAIAVDDSGNVFITGVTSADDFPVAHQFQTYKGFGTVPFDAYITKLRFTPACAPVNLGPAALPNATLDVPYATTLAATSSEGPITFAVSGGLLPAWLTLGSGGVLSGTPNAVGVISFTVTASSPQGCSASQSYTLTVGRTPPALPATEVTGQLAIARVTHSATLLQNGKVLVVGEQSSDSIGMAELYDPHTGTWSATGSLHHPRHFHNATLLTNGKVLVVGGVGSDAYLAGAELYDPQTGTWSETGSMSTKRFTPVATLLNDGRVLVAGGYTDNSGDLRSAEIYNPTTESWSTTGDMNAPRQAATSALLPDGRVLVAGGVRSIGGENRLTSCEIFDPHTGTWTPTGSLHILRGHNATTLLLNGRVLIAGGSPDNATELYDPQTGTWSLTGSLSAPRYGWSTTTLLPDGRVLLAGGLSPGGQAMSQLEVFDPQSGTWATFGELRDGRYLHTATLLPNGQVLFTGGQGNHGVAAEELYVPVAGRWDIAAAPQRIRAHHTATLLPNGKVLVAGGTDFDSFGIMNHVELYDPETDAWETAAPMYTARMEYTATLLNNGKVLVAGGAGRTERLATAELYDPDTDTWMPTGSLNVPRDEHASTLLPDGRVLVTGGFGDGSQPLLSAEIYDPNAGTWTLTASMAAGHFDHTSTLLPNGKVLVAGNDFTISPNAEQYDPANGTWSPTGNMHSARFRHTATLLPTGKVLVVGGSSGMGRLNSAELYDPSSGQWTDVAPMTTSREFATATLLPDGTALIAGGIDDNIVTHANCEVYDPASGRWHFTASLNVARFAHTATLLTDGHVLVVGGRGHPTFALRSAELYDRGLGFREEWRPVLSGVTARVFEGSQITASGSRFRGLSEASNGYASQNSATNYPLLQLRSLTNQQTVFLPAASSANWSDTSFTSLPLQGFPTGYALATIFTNAIPSRSRLVLIEHCVLPTVVSQPTDQSAFSGNSAVFTASGGGGALTAQWQVSIDGGITFTDIAAATGDRLVLAVVRTADSGKQYRVVYSNDCGSAFSNAATLNVDKAPTATSMESSVASPVYGQAFTLTARVTGDGGSPSGRVGFFDGLASLGEAELSSGVASTNVETLPAGTHSIRAVYSGSEEFNESSSPNLTLNVGKATPLLACANPQDIVYGAALNNVQLNATANIPGTFIYTPANGTILGASANQSLHVSFTPNDAANYNTTSKVVSINVLKALLSVIVADKSKVYGTANPPLTFKLLGFVNGDAAATALSGVPALSTTAQLNSPVGTYPITATVGSLNSNNYGFTFVSGTLTINKAPTTTAIGSTMFAANEAGTLTAVLLDINSLPIAGRTLTMTLGSGADAQTCSAATDAQGKATCQINHVSQPLGAGTVSVSFAGDVNYLASSGSAATLIYDYAAGVAGGNFVIGDLNAVIGQQVTFWGAQWATANSLSGGKAPLSFKGFANHTSTNPVACGNMWTTGPGNSSGPPNSVPTYMAVIVSNTITMSGSTIAGNVPQMVIVKTDLGYKSNPGHAGTGTVVAILCH